MYLRLDRCFQMFLMLACCIFTHKHGVLDMSISVCCLQIHVKYELLCIRLPHTAVQSAELHFVDNSQPHSSELCISFRHHHLTRTYRVSTLNHFPHDSLSRLCIFLCIRKFRLSSSRTSKRHDRLTRREHDARVYSNS